jgi:hypothetical protein
MKVLADGFSTEIDTVDKERWDQICRDFSDANIYQTWPYGMIRSGQRNVTHLLLKQNNAVIAAVQGRLARAPFLKFGIVYFLWGPLWKRRDAAVNVEVFRQALRAIRAEYVDRRKLVVRIVPNLPDSDSESLRPIFDEEAYMFQPRVKRRRTILMDIRPSTEQLYKGLHQKWRNRLNNARKQNLKLIEGEEDSLFEAFERIYLEMMDRKHFIDSTDPGQSRALQRHLTPDQKMKVVLCEIDGEVCAGSICSALGDTAVYLWGATSNRGLKSNASYLVHWRTLEWVKSRGCQFYDLNGIDPTNNPGVYQFKSRFAGVHGCDLYLVGGFDAYPTFTMKALFSTADLFRSNLKTGRTYFARWNGPKLRERSRPASSSAL